MSHFAEYLGLFAASFLAATILPFQSEAVLFGMVVAGHYQWLLLVLVASVGNTLGSVVNWFVGRFITRFEDRRWFPIKREALNRAEGWYHRYGRWSLLLSWAPFIGDSLTMVAGVLREPLLTFVFLVATAKTARYLAVTAVAYGWF